MSNSFVPLAALVIVGMFLAVIAMCRIPDDAEIVRRHEETDQ